MCVFSGFLVHTSTALLGVKDPVTSNISNLPATSMVANDILDQLEKNFNSSIDEMTGCLHNLKIILSFISSFK